MQKLVTFFFSKNISVYAIFNDQSFNDTFNDTLTNDIFNFEQLGLEHINNIIVTYVETFHGRHPARIPAVGR